MVIKSIQKNAKNSGNKEQENGQCLDVVEKVAHFFYFSKSSKGDD
jgi:hypothetical protein